MRRLWVGVLVVIAAMAASWAPGVGQAGRQPACAWRTFPLTDVSLMDIEALAASDVWAVGGNGVSTAPRVVHWDGRHWETMSVAAPRGVVLNAVSGLSSSDVWAVGWNGHAGGTAAFHWDGRRWRRVPTPNPPRASSSELRDVVTVSAKEAWAVGHGSDDAPALVARWSGRAWKRVTTPGAAESLDAVDASSLTNVWMVGAGRLKAIALHWNGRRWTSTPLPRAPFALSYLSDVSVFSGQLAWAVGVSYTQAEPEEQEFRSRSYAIRWNGARWQVDPTVNDAGLTGVHVYAPNRAWAWSHPARLARWNGSSWHRGPTVPFASRPDATIEALDTSPDGTLWLAGTYWNGTDQVEVIARHACRG